MAALATSGVSIIPLILLTTSSGLAPLSFQNITPSYQSFNYKLIIDKIIVKSFTYELLLLKTTTNTLTLKHEKTTPNYGKRSDDYHPLHSFLPSLLEPEVRLSEF